MNTGAVSAAVLMIVTEADSAERFPDASTDLAVKVLDQVLSGKFHASNELLLIITIPFINIPLLYTLTLLAHVAKPLSVMIDHVVV